MFERFTEPARRAIFFARYEASQFGCPQIETEFLLLGLFREDKVLATRFLLSQAKLEVIRQSIMEYRGACAHIATSVDLPLSYECKRALAYASEESERLNDVHIGTAHLLLGVLREKGSFAANLLLERGVTLELARERLRGPESSEKALPVSMAGLDRWLGELEAQGNVWRVRRERGRNGSIHLALYVTDAPRQGVARQDMAPEEKLAEIQKRIDALIEAMERSIIQHEFEKARVWAEDEQQERENLRQLREQFDLKQLPPRIPRVRVEVVGDDLFSDVGKRCEDYVAGGTGEVWILDPKGQRAYIVTKAEGLREFRGEVLRIEDPPLEVDVQKVFEWDKRG